MGANGLVHGNYYNAFGQNSATAPQVSGLASLIYSIDPNLTSEQIKNIIKTSSNDYGNLTWDGYGRINAYHALVLARGYGHITSDMTLCFDTEIKGDFIVDEGATLTIKPGVTLTFAANSDAANEGIYASLSELIVKGKVVFQGTAAEPVVFRSSSGQPQSWGGIRLEDESDDNSVISYCEISDARIGVYALSANSNPSIFQS